MTTVFVSHTSELSRFPPGRAFVDVVMSALAGLPGVTAVEQEESFFAEPVAPREMCDRRVDECGVYLGLIGWRFGSTVDGDEANRSFVEYEFDRARSKGTPRLVFVWSPEAVPVEFTDDDDFDRQKAFRKRLSSAQLNVHRSFVTAEKLAVEVKVAVQKHLGIDSPPEAEQIWCTRVPRVPPVFAGREELLEQLGAIDVREDGSPTQVLWSVTGQGGVGKTTLAAAFAERSRDVADVIWWARAEEPTTLTSDLVELADRLGIAVAGDPSLTIRALQEWCATTARRWLIVYDNVTTPDSVRDLLPKRGNGTVVLTTRNRQVADLGRLLSVDVWDVQTASSFLRRRVADANPSASDDPAVPEVADRLGRLALALEQAGAWVAGSPLRTYARYLERLDGSIEEALSTDTVPADYPTPAYAAWRLSLDAATDKSPLAGPILEVVAHLAPEPIPVEWLDPNDPYLDVSRDELEQALTALHVNSLIDLGPETLSLHRLTAEAARGEANNQPLATALRLLRQHCPVRAWDHQHWPTMAVVAGHVAGMRDRDIADLDEQSTGDWAAVLASVTTYLRNSGRVDAAIELGSMAVEQSERGFGPEDPISLNIRDQLARAHLDAGDTTTARDQFVQLIDDTRRIRGADHSKTLVLRSELARTYLRAGDTTTATRLYTELLADKQRILGPDDPSTLGTRHQLATAHLDAGDTTTAIEQLTSVLADKRSALGSDHPDTITTRHQLATAQLRAGDTTTAIDQFSAVLADRQRILGPDHPSTLTTRHQLATAHLNAGNTTATTRLYTELLADKRRILGPDHPSTLATRHQLATAHLKAGDTTTAIDQFSAVLTDRRRILGPDHPDTLTTRHQLASAHLNAADTTTAIDQFTSVLADKQRVLGLDHPSSIVTRRQLERAQRIAARG